MRCSADIAELHFGSRFLNVCCSAVSIRIWSFLEFYQLLFWGKHLAEESLLQRKGEMGFQVGICQLTRTLSARFAPDTGQIYPVLIRRPSAILPSPCLHLFPFGSFHPLLLESSRVHGCQCSCHLAFCLLSKTISWPEQRLVFELWELAWLCGSILSHCKCFYFTSFLKMSRERPFLSTENSAVKK